jgi:hypothetical protein
MRHRYGGDPDDDPSRKLKKFGRTSLYSVIKPGLAAAPYAAILGLATASIVMAPMTVLGIIGAWAWEGKAPISFLRSAGVLRGLLFFWTLFFGLWLLVLLHKEMVRRAAEEQRRRDLH